jgi:hypothetical protein
MRLRRFRSLAGLLVSPPLLFGSLHAGYRTLGASKSTPEAVTKVLWRNVTCLP